MKNYEAKEIKVGSLGSILFLEGFYYYVGSAARISRVKRHFRSKTKRWHIDYISDAFETVGAVLVKEDECELASKLKLNFIPRFGCSDCKCKSHLFYSKNLTLEFLFK